MWSFSLQHQNCPVFIKNDLEDLTTRNEKDISLKETNTKKRGRGRPSTSLVYILVINYQIFHV